jgi:hypothetical protein
MIRMPSTDWFVAFGVLNSVTVAAEPYMKASVRIVGCAFLMWEMLPFSSDAKLWYNGS